ncbi:hypothetical protein [Oscillatoria salina]|uniref:hypothetical protein n=1 Tax=Oscillatoria salina TaxID=331517 RepID=UPI0013BBF6B9|nr:hypothetical protein [Oscillatoria salina]MBZ8181636.1 hypothetical protein [Oscillatoria salina IIICB1]NET88681.1 hypothetical protein [Kamptonema sp. SIO1D9]
MKIKSRYLAGILITLAGWGILSTIVTPTQPVFAQSGTVCGNDILPERSFETPNFWIYICQVNGRLFYIGQAKNSANSIRLPANRRQDNTYTATNQSTNYFINSSRLEVYQNGRRIVSEPVLKTYNPNGSDGRNDSDLTTVPLAALNACRNRALTIFNTNTSDIEVTDFLPDRSGVRTILLRRRSNGTTATCRVTLDGNIISFETQTNPNPNSPEERTVLAFQTDEYAVRVYHQQGQLRMNVYDKRSRNLLLNGALADSITADGGTSYFHTRGETEYFARVEGNNRYLLTINRGSRTIYREPGYNY